MLRPTHLILAVATALTLGNGSLRAQDSGPLIDKLVQKGILNDQEAEDLRADLVKDFQSSSAGKINISSPVSELKLYGDGRLRYQYDDQQPQAAATSNVTQRSRFRYRLRLNADFRLTNNFFGGVQVETGQASDSANETVQPGYADSSIYINRVFLGVNIGDWATVIAGKQKNPFYTTDMVWDPDISPYGLTESVSFDKLFATAATPGESTTSGYGKDGKTVASYSTGGTEAKNWGGFKLALVAGQFVYDTNNDESAVDGDAKNDVFHFVAQLNASYEFNSKTAITFAPGFMIYNAGDLGTSVALNNETAFSNAVGFSDTDNDGIADFNATTGAVITNAAVSGESRDLAIVTAPGEFKFPIGSLNGRFYWDFAYNTSGHKRYDDVYGFGLLLPTTVVGGVATTTTAQRSFSSQDAIAWLAGLEVGSGKGKGAWTVFANYRETGLASIDPNLNDSDFALGKLNSRGFKFGTTYGVTDSVSLALTGFVTYNLDDTLADSFGLANRNSVNTVQFDVNFKF